MSFLIGAQHTLTVYASNGNEEVPIQMHFRDLTAQERLKVIAMQSPKGKHLPTPADLVRASIQAGKMAIIGVRRGDLLILGEDGAETDVMDHKDWVGQLEKHASHLLQIVGNEAAKQNTFKVAQGVTTEGILRTLSALGINILDEDGKLLSGPDILKAFFTAAKIDTDEGEDIPRPN